MSILSLGLNTFGDLLNADTSIADAHGAALRQVVLEARLADDLGVDSFTVGEHHRAEFAISSPETVLAAIASTTSRIRLGSGVTVLSSDDPVRVFERFATVDGLSGGRAEIILGRGSFTESFPLFGYDLADYDRLFAEKFDLLLALRNENPVTWSGTTRASLDRAEVFPTTASGHLPVWVGVGGTPQSVVRAASSALPVIFGILGGPPGRFAPYVELYHRATQQSGQKAGLIGVQSPGFIADTDDEAAATYYPAYRLAHERIGAGRNWPGFDAQDFATERESGSMYVGSPETVAGRIAHTILDLSLDRFDLMYTAGPIPAEARMHAVELFATRVVPRVRELVADARTQ
jgi:probable LLM family oxidoreductase